MSIPVDYIVKSTESTLGNLLLFNRRQFHIPYNQRNWSWKNDKIQVLWNDINKSVDTFYHIDGGVLRQRPIPIGNPHFIGAFVFVITTDTNIIEVVDGQQRITSIIMVMCILRELLDTITKDSTITPELKSNIVGLRDDCRRWLFAECDPGEVRPRLLVDEQFQKLFDSYILHPLTPTERESAYANYLTDLGVDNLSQYPKHDHLVNSFKFVNKIVRDASDKLTPDQCYYFILAVYNIISSAFHCIKMDVTKFNAYFEVFNCLNAKGTPLTATDKIKNELFNRSQYLLNGDTKQHYDIKLKWDNILSNIPKGDISTFLRFRHLAFIGECPKDVLDSIVIDKEINKATDVPSLVDRWLADSEWYKRLYQPTTSHFDNETIRLLNAFKTINVTYGYPFLLAAARHFLPTNKAEFTKAVRLCLNYCFRLLTICKEDVTTLEKTLGQEARAITTKSLADIAKELLSHNSDYEFVKKFSSISEKRVKVQFYILYEIEREISGASGLKPDEHSPKQHIEHIMPQSLSKKTSRLTEWDWARKDSVKHRDYLNRLGNLCILEANYNISLSNFDFEAKQQGKYPSGTSKIVTITEPDGSKVKQPRKSYKDSALHLVKELTDVSKYKDWSYDAIDARQKDLSAKAIKVWSLSV